LRSRAGRGFSMRARIEGGSGCARTSGEEGRDVAADQFARCFECPASSRATSANALSAGDTCARPGARRKLEATNLYAASTSLVVANRTLPSVSASSLAKEKKGAEPPA
ncbi:MAG TPA: hypothetical protein VIW03_19030, partial [Anaeromyxobacter sp.]